MRFGARDAPTHRSLDPRAMEGCLQKLRSFRYQMRNALGGDNLDTPDELAQKGIISNGGGSLSLGRHRKGSISFSRCVCGLWGVWISDWCWRSAVDTLAGRGLLGTVALLGSFECFLAALSWWESMKTLFLNSTWPTQPSLLNPPTPVSCCVVVCLCVCVCAV